MRGESVPVHAPAAGARRRVGWRGAISRSERAERRDERVAARRLGSPVSWAEAQQAERGARGAGRDRRVLEVLAARDQRLRRRRRSRRSRRARGRRSARSARRRAPCAAQEPALLAGRFEQRQQRLEQEGVVLEVGVDLGAARRCRCAAAARRASRMLAQHELRAGASAARPCSAARRARAPASASARDHQRVPARQALVVERRAHARSRGRQQPRADALARLRSGLRARGPGARSAPARDGGGRGSCPARSAPSQAIAAVGVRRRGASRSSADASRRRSAPRRPRSRRRARCRSRPRGRASRAAPSRACPRQTSQQRRLAVSLPAVQVGAGEQRVVVEHLLEVRHRPGGVDAVAWKPPPSWSWMPPAAIARSVASAIVALAAQQQELEHRGLRELRRAAEAAVRGVEALAQRARPPARARAAASGSVDGVEPRAARQALAQPLAAGADLVAARLARTRRSPAAPASTRHPVARLGREVGAAVERQLVGREEHVQRPAAVAGHALDGLHVERVDVGALLAVDLDAHEVLVHQRRRGGSSKDSRSITWHQWQAE